MKMNNAVEKIMEAVWYNPKKAFAVGLAIGAIVAKVFKKGIFAFILALIAGKIFLDAKAEQDEFTEEAF